MAEPTNCSTLKLIIEKGPREGETLQYPSGTVVKIGRVVRGNTIGIKDAGISSKHICIQFDNELCRWALSDLDSSNGTILNGQSLEPYVPARLKDGDCIKIGELTSILVNIGVEATIRSERKPRRQGKSGTGAATAVIESERSGLGLGFDEYLGKNVVEAPVEKRNLRSRAKKAVDLKNEVESSSSKRTLRSSRKEEKVSFVPTLNQIPEDLNIDERKATDQLIVPIESKKTQGGRKRKLPVQLPQDPDIVVPIDGRKTRRGRKALPVDPLENAQNSGLEENLNKIEESVRVDATEQPKSTQGAYEPLENVENSGLEGNLDTTNESAQDLVAEKLVLMQESGEGKEAIVDRSSLKGSSEVARQVDVDKGKEVAMEVEYRQNGCEDMVKDIGTDSSQWLDLEKMTLGEFFDCLKVQLPKEIYEKSEKILSHLKENARKCHEFRLQRNENGEGKLAMG